MLSPASLLDPSCCAYFFHYHLRHIVVRPDSIAAFPCQRSVVIGHPCHQHKGLGLQLDTDFVHSSFEVLDFWLACSGSEGALDS